MYNHTKGFAIGKRLAEWSLRQGDLAQALIRWQEVLELAATADQQVEALIGLHHSTWTIDPEQAKQYLTKALRVCENAGLPKATQGRLEQLLGITCRSLGQFQEAVTWYERCRATAKKIGEEGAWLYAEALNSQGYVYALIGDYEKGNTLVSHALDFRQRCYQQATGPKRAVWRAAVGYSYSTRGEIARFSGEFRLADAFYHEAMKIFRELRDQEWQALVLQQQGENARRIAWKHRKRHEDERAGNWFELAESYLMESKKLYEHYNLSRDRSRMLRRLARVVRDQGRFTEAEFLFHKSYELALDTKAIQEQLECLIDLAGIAIEKGDFDKIDGYLDQIMCLKGKAHLYPVFEALAYLVRGDVFYAQHRWAEALKEYSSGFVELGRIGGYGHAHLTDRLDRLPVHLDGLPDTETKLKWCRHLIETWNREGLEEKFPKLTELCSHYEEIMVFLSEGGVIT